MRKICESYEFPYYFLIHAISYYPALHSHCIILELNYTSCKHTKWRPNHIKMYQPYFELCIHEGKHIVWCIMGLGFQISWNKSESTSGELQWSPEDAEAEGVRHLHCLLHIISLHHRAHTAEKHAHCTSGGSIAGADHSHPHKHHFVWQISDWICSDLK